MKEPTDYEKHNFLIHPLFIFLIPLGFTLLYEVAFNPNPTESLLFKIPIFPFFFQYQVIFQWIMRIAILINISETFYIWYFLEYKRDFYYPEKTHDVPEIYWLFQTLIFGGPSIYTLIHPIPPPVPPAKVQRQK